MQSSYKQLNGYAKPAQRTPFTHKITSIDHINRPSTGIKRNGSNVTIAKVNNSDVRGVQHSLNNKNRYSSCTSIDYQRRDKSVSHMGSVEEKKIKQKYSYRTRQGVQINNPNKVNQDSLVIKTNLG